MALTRPASTRRLPRQHVRQPIEIGDEYPVERNVEREQAGLMGEQLADGDVLFPMLREFRPVRTDALVVIEPAA